MINTSDLLLQKPTEEAANSLLNTWRIGCTSFPFTLFGEVKDLSNRDWADEHGEDTYFPEQLKLKAFDLEVELAYKGSVGEVNKNLAGFVKYLTGLDGKGTSMTVYDCHTGRGYTGCYVKKYGEGDDGFHRSNVDELMSFKLTFRVTEPQKTVSLSSGKLVIEED